MFSQRLNQLMRFGADRPFTPGEHYVHRIGGITAPASAALVARARYWVLSRGLYHTRLLNLADIPANRRKNAIELACAAWTPYADTGHYIIAGQNSATLFAWDRALVRSAQSHANLGAEITLTVLPETALREWPSTLSAPPSASTTPTVTLRLVPMLDGVSALVARQGAILHEQWFADIPQSTTWQNFLRANALSALINDTADTTSAHPPPLSEALPWRAAPEGIGRENTSRTASQGEWWWLAFAAWLFTIPTIWFANEWRQVHAAKADALTRLSATERELDGGLNARGVALSALARTEKLAETFQRPDALLVLAQVNEAVGAVAKTGTLQMSELDYRYPQLRFALIAPPGTSSAATPPATTLIKAFERIPTWRDVQANIEGPRTVINARLEGVATVAPAQPDSASSAPSVATSAGAPRP